MFIGRTDAEAETPVLWPPHAKSWLVGKDSDAGRSWGQEEKGTTEDEMAGWHHQLDGHELERTLGVGAGQGGLVCCDSWGCKESDMTERLNWTELISNISRYLQWWWYEWVWDFCCWAFPGTANVTVGCCWHLWLKEVLISSYRLMNRETMFFSIQVQWVSEVAQWCLTLCDPRDCSLPGSFIHGVFQARVLEWVATSLSRRSSWPRDWTRVSCSVGRHFTTREVTVQGPLKSCPWISRQRPSYAALCESASPWSQSLPPPLLTLLCWLLFPWLPQIVSSLEPLDLLFLLPRMLFPHIQGTCRSQFR